MTKAPHVLTSLAIVTFAFLALGSATSYQPTGLTGGFEETQLAPNVWRVDFAGNGYTRTQRAVDFALLRSADLTLLNGFAYFALASSSESVSNSAITTPGYANTTFSGNTARTTYTGGQTFFVSAPSSTNTVVMFKDEPNIQGMIFDANFICGSLGKKYDVSCQAYNVKAIDTNKPK